MLPSQTSYSATDLSNCGFNNVDLLDQQGWKALRPKKGARQKFATSAGYRELSFEYFGAGPDKPGCHILPGLDRDGFLGETEPANSGTLAFVRPSVDD